MWEVQLAERVNVLEWRWEQRDMDMMNCPSLWSLSGLTCIRRLVEKSGSERKRERERERARARRCEMRNETKQRQGDEWKQVFVVVPQYPYSVVPW